MNKRIVLVSMFLFLSGAKLRGQSTGKGSLVERVGDTGFVRVDAQGFQALDPRQKQLAYWLVQASIAVDPIAYAQFSRFGLRQKRLLEEIVARSDGADPSLDKKIAEFTKLFWANRGNHDENTSQKFLPSFTFEELQRAALAVQKKGAFASHYADLPPLTTPAQLNRELSDLRASLFDPDFEPMLTAKSPRAGQDMIQASSNTFYEGVSLADLNDFQDAYALNSRVVKGKDGHLHEEVYRAGTPDGRIPAGLYATFLKRADEYLANAQQFAEPGQAKVIGDLIRYYQTGNPADWLQFDSDWVQNDGKVDFANGFIEVYRDARGAKGSSQSFVSITDKPTTDTMLRLGDNANYFEQQAPWNAQYKRQSFKPPVIKAIETLSETGDFGVTTIGDNLPNENEIHEKYGSKNFLFTSSTRALNKAAGNAAFDEFAATPEIAARNRQYGDESEDLETALHEVIGHGSGKLSERLKNGAEPYLKEYYSTLEEARADLMALWNAWDPKLKDLGLISNQEEVAKAMYDATATVVLMQLHRIPKGDAIEEDHDRDRQLIINFIRDRFPGAIEQFDRNGRTYIQVRDYNKMHQGVGTLLAELMRIKAEGDFAAIKTLVDKYGVHFDPALRDQVIARYQKLGLPAHWAGINSQLSAQFGLDGKIQAVNFSYPNSVEQQYLAYGSMYDRSLFARPTSHGSTNH
jgi:dipeptidyl-peptidase-3